MHGMASDRLNLTLDVKSNDVGPKRINVRSSLQVATLVGNIKDKFNLDGNYEIRASGGYVSLPMDRPLNQTGIGEGATLVVTRIIEATGTLEAIRRGERKGFSKRFKRAYLQEERTLTEFDLLWQPAVLGRRDHRNPSNNRLLAVDLEGIEPLPTVSRAHACITEANGSFFIEDIQGRNPVYVNGKKLPTSATQQLPAGAVIRVGRLNLTFNLIS